MSSWNVARRAPLLGLLASGTVLLLSGSLPMPVESPKTPPPGPAAEIYPVPVEIHLDYSEAPDLETWAEHAKQICIAWYPVVARILDSPDYTPPKEFRITFKEMRGIAYASGGNVVCAAKWFREHPDDYGAVVHEMAHVIQAYPRGGPSWLVEGIADYARWFNYELPAKRPTPDPDRAKYTDSYQTTAAFLAWLVQERDPLIVYRLNAALRKGEYAPELWSVETGKTVDELWKEYAATLPKRDEVRP